jgi:hypothetical protein
LETLVGVLEEDIANCLPSVRPFARLGPAAIQHIDFIEVSSLLTLPQGEGNRTFWQLFTAR